MQTKEGTIKAINTIKERYGSGYWAEIGSKGGKAKVPKGFATSGKASEAGKKGGARSSRAGIPNKPKIVEKSKK